MAPLKERAFTVSVVDERGAYVDGVQTQIFVNKIPSVQRYYRKGKPFVTHLSEGLQSVDVQVTFGKFRSRETVQTDIGTYTVTIPDEYVSQPANASPEPSVPAREPGTKTWVTVLGIAVPAVVALVVAYWQFVYKPEHQPKDFQIGIFVTDGSTRKPVPTASVTLVRATRKEDKPADSLGTARFQVYPEEAKNLRVEASAEGYAPGSREIDATGADKQFYLALSPLSLPKPKSGAGSNGGAVSPLVALAGTWEVVIESDVNNARLKKGTFDFMPQHDGSILFSTNFEADGMSVKATGTATMRQAVAFLQFSATTAQGGSWNGQGELTLSSDHRQVTGRIQSKRGDDIPLTLKKL